MKKFDWKIFQGRFLGKFPFWQFQIRLSKNEKNDVHLRICLYNIQIQG